MAEPEVRDKVMPPAEAIRKYVRDGIRLRSSGIGLRKPFAFIYEVLRQRVKDLTFLLSGWTEDADMLLGIGQLHRLEGSYLGLEALGLANNYRRAMEKAIPKRPEIEEYSNFGMTMRFMAASMGLPFMPIRSHLGSDLLRVESFRHPKAVVLDDPFGSGAKVALLPACPADVALIHAQRADRDGNVQVWGQLGDDLWGTLAGTTILASVEEIVDSDVIRRDPNRTLLPAFRVAAICPTPFGAHPYQCQGYYDLDIPFRRMYADRARTREGFLSFMDEWVYGVDGHDAYLRKLGKDRLDGLRAKPVLSDPVSYGY